MSDSVIITFNAVHKVFQQKNKNIAVLSGVTYIFESGKTYALTGASGTGKSTLIYLAAGLDSPTQGSIYYNQINSRNTNTQRKFLCESIGLVLQLPYLINELSILENVMIKNLILKSNTNDRKRALELLDSMSLADRAESSPSELSGGEQQRVAIARALFTRPKFIIADEPTAHLDKRNRDSIIQIFNYYQKEWGMGLILASHDLEVASAMETVLELRQGLLQETAKK